MGTPEFAVPSLEALVGSDDTVVGVVTQPDRPKGRGQVLTPPPVKVVCQREGLPFLQPTKMKAPEFLDALRAWEPDFIAVTAFGRILQPVILEMPPRGCINVHGSLLPKYRGAAPIQWAIMRGETETGITTIFMDAGMDTGDILLVDRVQIEPDETAGALSVRLAEVGGRLLVETIRRIKDGTVHRQPQDHTLATMAPILKKEDGLIDWQRRAVEIANQVRGLSPWPGAYTYAEGDRWVVWSASVAGPLHESQVPGTVIQADKDGIRLATGEGMLVITELQPANSRKMTAAQFLAGHRIRTGLVLGKGPEASTG